MTYYQPDERVHTPDGPGSVIADRRLEDQPPHDSVWVLLDSGDNPQRYDPEELS